MRGRCPPFISTALHPSARIFSAAARACRRVRTGMPDSAVASGALGVTRQASGSSSCFSARSPSSSISLVPSFARITGSITRLGASCFLIALATSRTTAALASIPVFAAPGRMSESTASNCSRTCLPESGHELHTPRLFWAVMAVTTAHPKTPSAENVLRSAWIPAPPDGSEPAIVSATGAVVVVASSGGPRSAPSAALFPEASCLSAGSPAGGQLL